jgi:hypothetical protein
MTSPFERLAQEQDIAAKLPVDNWRQRRIDGIRSHSPSIAAVGAAIDRLGNLVLDGRISTDVVRQVKEINVDTTNPSEELAEATIGIRPTGAPRRWEGYGVFTPDAALAVAVHLKDQYDYQGTGRPRPLGQVSLALYARSWGRITPEEKQIVETVEGACAEYGDNGYDRRGTRVTVWREAGQTLDQSDVETVLAPLAGHVLHYFDIMGLGNPGVKQPTGNFSNRDASSTRIEVVSDTPSQDNSWTTRMLLGE